MKHAIRAALTAALVARTAAVAQDRAYPGLVFRLPAGARTLAMGNVGIVGRDDDVLFYNPAQLVAARGTSASVERFSRHSRGGTLSSVIRFGSGGVGIGATMTDFRAVSGVAYPLDRLDMRGDSPRAMRSSNTLAIGVAQGFKVVRLGATVKYLDEPAYGVRNTASVFDAGITADFANLAIGIAVQNMGPGFDVTSAEPGTGVLRGSVPSSSLPLMATFGAGGAGPVGMFDVAATAAVSWLRDGFVIPAGGAEVGWSWLEGYTILGRVGARRPLRGEGPLTAGAGFVRDRVAIDYAIETLSGGRAGHRFGVRIR